MKVIETGIEQCVIIEPTLFQDDRGFFLETFHHERYAEKLGIKESFVQDNHSYSKRGVLRGLHFQRNRPQGKLVRVVSGEVFDVAVDLRKKSSSFGKWIGVKLSGRNKKQLWVPAGFAHGFLVLSEHADFEYKCTSYYDPLDEGTIHWNDDVLGINWPLECAPVVSKKDAEAPLFNEAFQR